MTDPAFRLPVPFDYETPATPTGAVGRKCRRHQWGDVALVANASDLGSHLVAKCIRCGRLQVPERSRRGRQSRNYGNRAELAIARQYGGRKIGQAGGPVDIEGRARVVQVKTSRRAVPPMWRGAFTAMEPAAHGRLPVLLLRFVRAGALGPDDYVVIRGADFLSWYGEDREP